MTKPFATPGARVSELCLQLAIDAEAWPSEPSFGAIADALESTDRLMFFLGRLIVPDETPLTLNAASRALYALTVNFDRHAPDRPSIDAALRLAIRSVVAANQLYKAARWNSATREKMSDAST